MVKRHTYGAHIFNDWIGRAYREWLRKVKRSLGFWYCNVCKKEHNPMVIEYNYRDSVDDGFCSHAFRGYAVRQAISKLRIIEAVSRRTIYNDSGSTVAPIDLDEDEEAWDEFFAGIEKKMEGEKKHV